MATDPRKLKERATEAFQKGKFVKAGEAYAEYCQADQKDLQARLRMGDAWAKGGKKDKAIEAYSWAAEGFAKNGFLPRAIAASKLILELDPSHQGVQKMLADLYARKTTAPAGIATGPARSAQLKVETKVEPQTTAVGFSHRKDAIELDARPVTPAPKFAAPSKVIELPSPMNRVDAIELPEYVIPGVEAAVGSGSASVPLATRGPSPTRNEAAIDIGEEPATRNGPSELSRQAIDLDISGQQGGAPSPRPSGPDVGIEIEVPIEGVEIVTGTSPAESFELKVDAPPSTPPPPPPAENYELHVEAAAPAPLPAQSHELTVELAPVALQLEAPAAKVWDLSADEPLENTISEELELVDVEEMEPLPAGRLEVKPEPPSVAPSIKPVLEVVAEAAAPGLAAAAADLEILQAPMAAVTVPPERVRAEAPGEQSGSYRRSASPGEESGSYRRSDSAGEKSGAFTAPPGLKPRRPAPEAPMAAAEPAPDAGPPAPAGRIWLPGNFAPPGIAAIAPVAELAPIAPVAIVAKAPTSANLTDLERGMQIFSGFDADDFKPTKGAAPPPPPPEVAPPRAAARSSRTFTELELDGESLLHAVEAAAAVGVEQRGEDAAHLVEEAMEMPDDQKLEPGELPKIPLFSDLPPEAFIALFERCPLKRVEPGEIVIQQGSLGDSFYVICAGSVRVFRMDAEQRREIATLEEGAFFGEMALLSGAARTASVEAASEDTQLLEISAPILTELSLRYPQVATALKKFCRQRLLSNLIGTAALFQPFNRNDRRELVQKFKARDVPKGGVLIKEGQRSDGMYVILSGEVEVRVGSTQIAYLKEGDVFGEMSLLTKTNATATVAASKHTSLLRLPREDFDLIIMSHPQVLVLVSELTDARTRQNASLVSHGAGATPLI